MLAAAAAGTRATDLGPGEGDYHPLAQARARGDRIDNREAPIPIQCYTKTQGRSNPCWTCHTDSTYPNLRNDADLQREYSFSTYGEQNRWSNAWTDHSEAIAAISDADALEWVRHDNYGAARRVLAGQMPRWAYGWDLDFHGGFDDEGFARDGSGWRAFRYKPFPGAFWPTNGSTDDVLIRLPARFRQRDGVESPIVYKANLALLEASVAADPNVEDAQILWPTEALDERLVGLDLDADGDLGAEARALRGLPSTFVGDARDVDLERGVFPEGTEFLHSVRYLDPDAPGLISVRMKELRYLRREQQVPRRRYFSKYEQEANDKDKGILPRYQGDSETGLLSTFGWRVQGYIEDAQGRLRLQTREEHYACMGCHFGIGVTADGTFSFARKVPGAAGWGYQAIDDLPDVPQLGHAEPEVLTYLRRVGGGDELRSNDEMLARFFPQGKLDETRVRRAAPGGPDRLPDLVAPSRERALLLDKAYMALVSEQSFERGRDTIISPPDNVHRRIEETSTGLAENGRDVHDGTIRLDWTKTELWCAAAASLGLEPCPR
ncbi:MAG: hypothetical protein AAF799_26045 [Myxococcota bacterium]